MRLQPVEDTHGQRVVCYGCGKHPLLKDCHADLDGEAFKAYYCLQCTAELQAKTRQPTKEA
jgi:hypothetical protein